MRSYRAQQHVQIDSWQGVEASTQRHVGDSGGSVRNVHSYQHPADLGAGATLRQGGDLDGVCGHDYLLTPWHTGRQCRVSKLI